MTSAWPDTEGALRDLLRADSGVSALAGNRVFFGLPAPVKFPADVVRRAGGGQDPGETPIDRPLVMIDCWGIPGDKAGAHAITAAVRDALSNIRSATTQGATVLYGANVIGAVFVPDPETDQPRYSLTVDVTARAVLV